MKHFILFKPDNFIRALTVSGSVIAVIYFFCMFIAPLVQGGGDWTYVQQVWDRWQSLNVGLLAFVSSITALNISRFNSEKQRERDFLASKAFLPSALSELVAYFKESASVYKKGWEASVGKQPAFQIPELPKGYKPVFQECIRHAEPDVGDYLARILVRLQVHDARLQRYVSQEEKDGHFSPEKHNLIYYFRDLGELLAMVHKLFGFARSMAEFDYSPLNWDDFHTAYANLDISEYEIKISNKLDLESVTKRYISGSYDQDA